jgi:hypothetical protein
MGKRQSKRLYGMKMINRSLLCALVASCTLVAMVPASASHSSPPPSMHYSAHSAHAWGPGHGHGHNYFYGVGFYGGWPWYYPWYFDYPGPYYSDGYVVQPAAPVAYVEMAPPDAQAKPAQSGAWYYCKSPEGYYPYVKSCAAGWEVVPAQPPVK